MKTNTFTITGLLVEVTPKKSKEGKDYCNFVVATSAGYGATEKQIQIPIVAFGYSAKKIMDTVPNTNLLVMGELSGRFYEGKCYGEMVAREVFQTNTPSYGA